MKQPSVSPRLDIRQVGYMYKALIFIGFFFSLALLANASQLRSDVDLRELEGSAEQSTRQATLCTLRWECRNGEKGKQMFWSEYPEMHDACDVIGSGVSSICFKKCGDEGFSMCKTN